MNIREFYEQEWRKIAHDIRTPLAVLSLCHQQLEAHMQDTEKQEEYKELLGLLNASTQKINQLVENVHVRLNQLSKEEVSYVCS